MEHTKHNHKRNSALIQSQLIKYSIEKAGETSEDTDEKIEVAVAEISFGA